MLDHFTYPRLKYWSNIKQMIRAQLLRRRASKLGCNVNIGSQVRVEGNVYISDNVTLGNRCTIKGNVTIGSYSTIEKDVEISGNVRIGCHSNIGVHSILSTMPSGKLEIGDYVIVNAFNILGAGKSVIIEDDCIFAAFVQITDSTHQFESASASPRHDPAYSENVIIQRGVWLGSSVKVLRGVSIGLGAVVGAGSVVTKSLPKLSVSVGMPAKVIRYRT